MVVEIIAIVPAVTVRVSRDYFVIGVGCRWQFRPRGYLASERLGNRSSRSAMLDL